jgi:FAD/FMN-containing dehydrogenase
MRRRDVLKLAGGLGLASVATAACSDDSTTGGSGAIGTLSPPSSSSKPPTIKPTTAKPSTPAAPAWSTLAATLDGRLARPGDPTYATAARLYNPRFDRTAHPAAVARCASAAHVAAAVRFAADSGVEFALRSGGHSYPGWSTGDGLVVDVSALSAVSVDAAAKTARIGAGAKLGNVYAALAAGNVGIAAGSCPTVGMAGLALGGGVGVLSRVWGLTCDTVTSVDVVTADGNLRTVSAGRDADLFWALRGGGGGSFGAVTAFTVAVRPVPSVTTFYHEWAWSDAAEVLTRWQGWLHAGVDSRVTTTCKLLADAYKGSARVLVAGTWTGPSGGLDAVLAPLLGALPAPRITSTHPHTYASAMLLEAGCSGQTATTCVAQALTPDKRQPFSATSSIAAGPLPAAGVAAAVARVDAAAHVSGIYEGGVSFDALGGAVGDLAADATAFGHRTAFATVQYTATWTDTALSPSRFDTYVRGFRAAMRPWLGDGAYANYADASITDYGTAYWGANYPRLQQVKSAYDPGNLFRFPQSVKPAG